jgi:hypothetical protein
MKLKRHHQSPLWNLVMVVIVSDLKNGSIIDPYGIYLISSHFGVLIGGGSVAMFSMKL